MWTQFFFLLHIILLASAHPFPASAEPSTPIPRDLVHLLGANDLFSSGGTPTVFEPLQDPGTSSGVFGGIVTSETKTRTTPTASAPGGTTHSVIGTLPIYNTPPIGKLLATTTLPTSANMATPSASIPTTLEAASTPPAEATEWKVIGLVVVSISFVATVILSVVFFDSWSAFLRDLVLGRRQRRGVEDMVPDWEKRSWEFKLANEDGHRYPTLASLECITKEHTETIDEAGVKFSTPQLPKLARLGSPNPLYVHDYDPHPLEPLSRRPSTRPMPPPHGGV